MKKLSNVIAEASNFKGITGIVDSINFIKANDLKKYLEVADVCLSQETKEIVKWLITNNTTYLTDLSNDLDENAIVGFYNQGRANVKDEKLQQLWDLINIVNKNNRILEIPVLQTQANFNKIISKEVPADFVILKLDTEEGRNDSIKRYNPLIEKLIGQWKGKSSFDYDELKSFAYEGMTWALNTYGKKGNKSKAEDQNIVNKSFGQYAAYMIRFCILENIKNLSHTVRIPISQQKKEKELKGTNRKSNTLSGDKVIGHNDEGNKTLFDFLGYMDTSTQTLDNEDLNKLWKEVLDELEKKFSKETMDIFYSFYGINDHPKLQNKEIAAKYNCGPSKITYYCSRVINYIRTTKKIRNMFSDINELMHECLAEREENEKDMEPYYINLREEPTVME